MKLFTSLNKIPERCFALIFWLIIWQLLYIFIEKEILFVSPFGVGKAFFALAVQGDFWGSVILSLGRMLAGYLLALIAGIITACLCVKSRFFDILYNPLMSVIKAIPVASFSLLVLLWVQTGFVPIIISFLMVVPIIWANTKEGLHNIENDYLEMVHIYCFTNLQKLRLLYLPSLTPYLLAACKTGIGIAWKSAIAAEVICTPAMGIGKRLYETKLYLDSPSLFAWTGVIILCSIFIEKLFVWAISKIKD